MKTTIRLSCLLMTVFSCTFSSAQTFYKPGSVTTNNGEIIRGWIDYRQWGKNPDSIKFRQTENSSPVIYSLNNVAYFEIDGLDRYERAVVSKDMRPVEMSELETVTTDTTIVGTVFLRVLVKGELSLYEYYDSKPHFYIKEEGKDYQELFYKVYLVDANSRLFTRHIFRDQLKGLLVSAGKPDALMPLLKAVNYKEKDLVKAVEKINGILYNGAISYKIPKQKQPVSVFAGGGLAYATLRYYSGPRDNLSNLRYSSSAKPMIVGGVDIAMSRNLQRVVIRFEVPWYRMQFEGKNDPASVDSVRYHLSMSSLAPSLTIRYNLLNLPNEKLFLGLGIGYNFTSYKENILHKKYGDFSNVLVRSPHLDLEKAWLGIHAKAGFIMSKRFEIVTTAMFDGSFANFSNFSLKPTILFANLNYHFLK